MSCFVLGILYRPRFLVRRAIGSDLSFRKTGWRLQMVTASTCSSARMSWSSGIDEDEHNIWNPFLRFRCHHRIGFHMEGTSLKWSWAELFCQIFFATRASSEPSPKRDHFVVSTTRGAAFVGGLARGHQDPWRVTNT